MKKLVLFLALVYSTIIIPQNTDTQAIIPPQGFGINLLNSSGNSSIDNDISNIGFMNPAAISNFNNYSFGFSYQFSSSIDEAWVADIGISRIYNFFPQSFGGVIKFNDFTFGLGFGQKFNGASEFGPVLVTTTQNPDGNGEYLNPIQETVIYSYSLTAVYNTKNLLDISNDLSLGFRFSINRFHRYEELVLLKANANDYSGSFAFGLSTGFLLDEARKITLGLFYETETTFRANYEYDNNSLLISDIDTTRPPQYYNVVLPVILNKVPAELKFDLTIDATQNLRILTNLTSVFWETETNNLKDQIEFSSSAIYRVNEIFIPSIGFYYTDYKFKETFYSRLNGELNAFFITAGLKYKFENFYVDLALADSHLLSGDFRKQTIGKITVGVNL